MKRVLASLALSVASAAALGQTYPPQQTAIINQQGSLGTATVEQEFSTGPFHLAVINQGPGVGSRAAVSQTGAAGHVLINQTGDRQTVRVVQQVDGADVNVTQGGGSDNLADIDHGGSSSSVINLRQIGSANTARIVQSGLEVLTDVTQRGNLNSVTVSQPFGDRQEAVVAQDGTRNRAELGLVSGYVPLSTSVIQYGTDNLATVDGFALSSSITQDGAANQADIALTDLGFGGTTQATIDQRGTANRATIVSVGDNNLATIRQGGQNNLARIDQNGSGLVANIVQNTVLPGYGNTASIVQR
jgi:hypothetical protein